MKGAKILPFNPLDKRHLGESVGQAMLRQPVIPLADLERFEGAGVYAIYHVGAFEAYETLSQRNKSQGFTAPIYVGKAVPKGARKGGTLESEPGAVLFNRLMQHRRSIDFAENLTLPEFFCRYLVVDDIWMPLGESLLIARFCPLWNLIIDGFGNHDPGKGRHAGLRPRWDVLHPGRPWADRCRPREETPDQIAGEIRDFLNANSPGDGGV